MQKAHLSVACTCTGSTTHFISVYFPKETNLIDLLQGAEKTVSQRERPRRFRQMSMKNSASEKTSRPSFQHHPLNVLSVFWFTRVTSSISLRDGGGFENNAGIIFRISLGVLKVCVLMGGNLSTFPLCFLLTCMLLALFHFNYDKHFWFDSVCRVYCLR